MSKTFCPDSVHDQLKADDNTWNALAPARGGAEWHDDELGIHLSTRNCACGATLSKALPGHID